MTIGLKRLGFNLNRVTAIKQFKCEPLQEPVLKAPPDKYLHKLYNIIIY